jgi:hypothetical protein
MRTLKTLFVAAMVVLLADRVCHAWSLWPFSSDSKSETQAKKHAMKPAAKPPSTFEKIATGTKNLFTKPAEAIGLKKPPPKKPTYATARLTAPKKEQSSSLFGSMFQSKEPAKPDSAKEWIAGQRPEF